MGTRIGEESTGTTLVAIQCVDGVVLAADSRSSVGTYVSSRDSDKITQIGKNLFVMRSGSAAHTQALSRYANYFLNVVSVDGDAEKKQVTLAAQVLRKLVTSNRDNLTAALIVAGIDEDGPAVWNVQISGMAIKRKVATSGSGSSYITAQLDDELRDDLTVDEATQIAIRGVTAAISRDGASGGLVNVVQIRPEGSKRFVVRPASQPFNDSVVKT